MSTEPYTPTEAELVQSHAFFAPGRPQSMNVRAAAAKRGIAKIKAEALREAADEIDRDHLTDELAHEGYDGDGMMPGDVTVPEWLKARAHQIEKEGRDG